MSESIKIYVIFFLAVCFVTFLVFGGLGWAGAEESVSRVGIAYVEDDILIVIDGAGIIWSWKGSEDICTYDVVSFTLTEQGKPNYILDDEPSYPTYSAIPVDKEYADKVFDEHWEDIQIHIDNIRTESDEILFN